MDITIHHVNKIKASKVQKLEVESGRIFYVKKFFFTGKDGEEIEVKAFADNEAGLKIKQ